MSRYRIPSSAVVQNVGAESVILNLDDGHYYGLDEVGTRIIELVAQDTDTDSIAACLESEYAASADRIRADLETLLQDLLSHGLVEPAR